MTAKPNPTPTKGRPLTVKPVRAGDVPHIDKWPRQPIAPHQDAILTRMATAMRLPKYVILEAALSFALNADAQQHVLDGLVLRQVNEV